MIKLSILTLSCALVMANTTWAAQDPANLKAKHQQKQAAKTTKAANAHFQPGHHLGQGTTNNNAHVNKTAFNNTNKTVNNNTNKTINNNKTVNKVQTNNHINNQANVNVNTGANAKVKTLHQANAAKWNQIHQQHQNFHATANNKIASAKFNAKFHIAGANNWKGAHYAAFKNYHPMWHDHFWWHNHYHNNVILIGGGWYYWNSGYWYPAWGYDDSASYYPYDGPIYVGSNPTPPDQIIADVQTSLQEQGFYHGEVDGLLGPLTRAALADYQQAQGLEMTAAVDEPTLESLGVS